MSDYERILKEALLNNSFDDSSMTSALKRTWFNSFSYLLTLQQANIEYEELCFFSGEGVAQDQSHIGKLYVNKLGKACFDVDYDLIHVSEREEYRTSEYYLTQFDFTDLVNNPKIFVKMPIVIIDDQVIWDYKLLVNKDSTSFILPFKKSFVISQEWDETLKRYKYINHKIQFLIVDNCFYGRYTFNRNSIGLKTDKTFVISKEALESVTLSNITSEVNTEFIKKYNVLTIDDLSGTQDKKRRQEIKKRFHSYENTDQVGTMMCSIHYPNIKGNDYELGTILIPLVEYEDYYLGTLTDDLYDVMSTCSLAFYVSLVFIEKLMCHEFYTGFNYSIANENGCELLCLEQSKNVPYPSPIPVENFMVFKIKSGSKGYILEHNTKMITLHYPNIYQVTDEQMKVGEKYQFFYFYHEEPELHYTVMFDFYFRFIHNRGVTLYGENLTFENLINLIYYHNISFDGYTEEEKESFYKIFEDIYNYKYFHHLYGETDFLKRYIKIEGHEDDTPFEYKVNTLKEWIRVEPWVLRDYVLEQDKLGTSYHLFTNTLNLASRKRTDTSQELDTEVVKFNEDTYVFALNNDTAYPDLLDIRVFVDGLCVVEDYHYRKLFVDYIYIPTRYVTNDSYIEIEIFPAYQMEEVLNFSAIDEKKEITLLDVSNDIFPTTADLFYRAADGERITASSFEITTHTEKGGEIVVKSDDPANKPVKFTRLTTFDVRPLGDEFLNKDITLSIKKKGHAFHFIVEHTGFLILKFINSELDRNFNEDYIRIFDNNGRLIPRSNYKLITIFNNPYIYFLDRYNKGDEIVIDFTPYRYKEICHIENIEAETTLIDLSEYVDKPIDIRYYDVYLNGRKLSINNVFPVSPYQMTLVNLHSIYNLDIYEKERDWEFFGLDYKEHLYYFSFEDLVESGAITENEKNKLIKDIIDDIKDSKLNIYPNTNEEEKQPHHDSEKTTAEIFIYYFDNLLPKTFVDPDTFEESTSVMDENFEKIKKLFLVNSNTYMLDPDLIYEGENEHVIAVYPVGHLDEVSDEILNQKIVIEEKYPIDK